MPYNQLLTTLKALGQAATDLVFPVSCLVCGRENAYLCARCTDSLPRQKQQCLVCQKPSPFGKTHPDCTSRNTVDGFVTSLPYSHPDVKKIITAFKFSFVDTLAGSLASLMIQAIRQQGLQDYFGKFTLIPVPLHPRRLKWRGFNQSQLLADKLASQLNLPAASGLIRTKNTKPQADLDRESRKTNITDAFAVAKEVTGQKILLVDDVATTGTTLNEIAKLLKQAHVGEVWAITAAHG